MRDIIETHIMLEKLDSFQTRIIEYDSFEKYVDDIKNNKCSCIHDKYDTRYGYSRSPKLEISIVREDIERGSFIYDMFCVHGVSRCYCAAQ